MSQNRKKIAAILSVFLVLVVLAMVLLIVIGTRVGGKDSSDEEETRKEAEAEDDKEEDKEREEKDGPNIGQVIAENPGKEEPEAPTETAAPTEEQKPTEGFTLFPSEEEKPSVTGSGNYGIIDFSGTFVEKGTAGGGVMSITENEDGSVTLGLLRVQWEDGSVTVWKNADGSYDIQGVTNGNNVIGNALGGEGVAFDWEPIHSDKRFTLTPEMADALQRVYGFRFN